MLAYSGDATICSINEGNQIVINALVRDFGDFPRKIAELKGQMADQKKDNPLGYWFEHGLNCQLGMQLIKACRPRYSIPAKSTFFTIQEYLTIQYYGVIEQHEEVKDKIQWFHVRARFAALPFHDRKYFMFVEMNPKIRLSTGDRLKVSLDWYTDSRDRDWVATVQMPLPFSTSQDYTTILSRPFVEDKYNGHFDDTEIPEESVLNLQDHTDTESVREKITTMPPTQVKIRLESSDEATRRQINTLREMQQNQAAHENALRILCAANLRSLSNVDAFADIVKLHGEDKLQQATQRYCGRQNSEQREATEALRNLPGGILLLQGSPGTGKTTWIVDIVTVCFSFATVKDPTQIVLLAGTNAPLDDLAAKVSESLYKIYAEDSKQRKFPIVIREHSIETEASIYLHKETAKGKQILGTRVSPPTLDPDVNITELAVAQMLLQTYQDAMKQRYEHISDKRVRNIDLSLGMWMLRAAGLPLHSGGPHPIAHPDMGKFSEFRAFLRRYGMGDKFSPIESEKFTNAATEVRNYVHSIADVQLSTLNNYQQAKVYQGVKAKMVLVDESAKAAEADIIGALVWNTAPTRIFVGDMFQLKPVTFMGREEKAFEKQMAMPFFSRALHAGYKSVWFNTQHRYSKDICNLLNTLGYRRLVTQPEVENRYSVRMAKDFMRKTFSISGTVCLLNLPSGYAKYSSINPSKMNLANIKLAYFIYLDLLLKGWKARDIGIATPYVAQQQQYLASHHNMVQYLANYNVNPRLAASLQSQANEVKDTEIFTFDSIQGLEREVIILDLTISDKLGFLKEAARLVVGVSRPRSMLIIIANVDQIELSNPSPGYKRTKVARLIEYCKTHNCCVNIVGELAEKCQAQFTTAEDLGEKRVHFVRNNNITAHLAFTASSPKSHVFSNVNQSSDGEMEIEEHSSKVPAASDPVGTEMETDNAVQDEFWGDSDINQSGDMEMNNAGQDETWRTSNVDIGGGGWQAEDQDEKRAELGSEEEGELEASERDNMEE